MIDEQIKEDEIISKEEQAWRDVAEGSKKDMMIHKISGELAVLNKEYAEKRAKEENKLFRKV